MAMARLACVGDDYTAEASTRRGPEFGGDDAYSIRHTPRRYSLLTLVSANGKVSRVTCVRSTARRLSIDHAQ